MTDDEYTPQYVTREEAVAQASEMAERDLVIGESEISFVSFVPVLGDYCRSIFERVEVGQWQLSSRSLRSDEREPHELITDEAIVALARDGKTIGAIRLYRTKYDCDLAEAKRGLDSLLS